MSSVVLLPLAPEPPPPGEAVTLAAVEREVASRVGPFALLEVLSADQGGLVVEVLKSTIDLGGYEDLYVLRREATIPADRVARVKTYDPLLGRLAIDRAYVAQAGAGEPVELHHLPPELLRRGVRAGLRRTFCQFWLALDGDDPDAPVAPYGAEPETGPVDLTEHSGGWLRLPQQVLDVLDPQRDGQSVDGWRAYQHNGRAFLLQPAGGSNVGLTVVASRPHFTLVDGAYAPDGPTADDDELDVDLMYAAAFGHAELWRIARDRLEVVAAEGRQATQQEAAAEATRLAVAHAPWLFSPGQTRKDRVGPLYGLQGAGGGGAASLTGAVVNGPDWMAPAPGRAVRLGLPAGRNGTSPGGRPW